MAVRRLVTLALLYAVMGAPPLLHHELLATGQAPGSGVLIDRVVAVVEGQVILLSDVRAFRDLQLIAAPDAADPTPVLTALIERQLILDQARYLGEAQSSDEVDARLADVVGRAGGTEAFEERLLRVGFTVDDLRYVLRDDLRIERYLARRFVSARRSTEDEVVAYFREHADEFLTDGVLPSFDAARGEARRRLSEGLRQERIDDWVALLAARADVFRVSP